MPKKLRKEDVESADSELPSLEKTRVPSTSKTTKTGDNATPAAAAPPPKAPSANPAPPWHIFVRSASETEITTRFGREAKEILEAAESQFPDTCFITLLDAATSITQFELDRIYATLITSNPDKMKDVVLIIQSPGGSIEPAYQISKICKSYSHNCFRVIVPRFAKSAATLIALGADEIHMGPLSQLGPIDPQIDGLPALGVSRALTTIAELSESFPGSAEMFATYLQKALTVEQIGYCERISESAEQYAERLLSNKENLPRKASVIAKELVREYKDHSFVIDYQEAKEHLGEHWIHFESPYLSVAERLYGLFEIVNVFLGMVRKKKLLVVGDALTGVLLIDA